MKHFLFIMCIMLSAVVAVSGCSSSKGNSQASASSKQLLSFDIVSPASAGVVDELNKTVAVTVPYGTDITALKAAFETNGSTTTVNGVEQISGETANNFTSPLTYVVEGSDGSVAAYLVKVTVALSSDKDITSFKINGVSGTITGTDISLTLPYGTVLKELFAQVTITGASLSIGTITANGMTGVNFESTVVYTVTAFDGSTKQYSVNVTTVAIDAKTFTSFAINGYKGTINGTAISVILPYGTTVTALIPVFTFNGSSVLVSTTTQTSGSTSNDFTSAVTYIVTAADASTVSYTVTVTVAQDQLLTFAIGNSVGVITGTSVAVTVPHGTAVNALVAAFTLPTGTTASVGNTVQTSGTTANDFTNPVVYTVTATDATTASYTVTVRIAPSIYAIGHDDVYAVYWKDGVETKLSDGTQAAHAYAMVLSGSDIYVGGADGNYAVYWKNGVENKLTDGSSAANVSQIVISGSTFYFGGSDGDKAVIWKDGKALNLSSYGNIYDMAICNGDLYACGWEDSYAVLWKNGNAMQLGSGTAERIFVSGTDIYVAGYTSTASSIAIFKAISRTAAAKSGTKGSIPTCAVWKNGTLVNGYSSTYGELFAIAVSGTTIYTGGEGFSSSFIFWENGIGNSAYTGYYINDIVVSGKDVISGGRSNNCAAYWVNGAAVTLSPNSSWVNRIMVAE